LKRVAEGKSNKIIFPLELSRLASLVSEQSGWKKGEHDSIAKSLLDAYLERQKESLDKPSPSDSGEEKK
jgi:hypothetical protein